MSAWTHIYGYIELELGHEDYNRAALDNFVFDELQPFRNTFYFPRPSRRRPLIAFADVIKELGEIWEEWRGRFEELLGTLRASQAAIKLFSDSGGYSPDPPEEVYYFNHTPRDQYSEPGKKKWIRLTYEQLVESDVFRKEDEILI